MLEQTQDRTAPAEHSVAEAPSDDSLVTEDPNSAKVIGAIAHLYRAEVFRSTTWRTRLDTTTNWAVVTTGVALSLSYSDANASSLPLVLVGMLVMFFLLLEARRYRYFNVWRWRARVLELGFYVPMLRGNGGTIPSNCGSPLAADYETPKFRISYLRAVGRRLRRNYCWILVIQLLAYLGKLMVHPADVNSVEEFLLRAHLGPLPGEVMLGLSAVFHGSWLTVALLTWRQEVQDGTVTKQVLDAG